ncbi:adhesion G-protein coupled receptor F1-like [Engraulis encrasicolus]|uniref:adhesion G-protein coupled receptor F1-like n=1 Tax=Engraulis encrasicolus TaxID=184585 RepID=UPI002FD17C7E
MRRITLKCQVQEQSVAVFPYSFKSITLTLREEVFACYDQEYGSGNLGDIALGPCAEDEVGNVTFTCQGNEWVETDNNCVLFLIFNLEEESQALSAATLPAFVESLTNITVGNEARITNSTGNVKSIVNILGNVGQVSQDLTVTVAITENFFNSSSIIVSNATSRVWGSLNGDNTTRRVSSSLLEAAENMVRSLQKDISIETGTAVIQLRQTVNPTFNETLQAGSSATISITEEGNFTVTTVAFSTGNIFLPDRNGSENSENSTLDSNSTDTFSDNFRYGYSDNFRYRYPDIFRSNVTNNSTDTDNSTDTPSNINAAVILVQINVEISNISLTFDLINETEEGTPQCVFWNFDLLDGLGAWDTFGCELTSNLNGTVTCECNHTTSFSILMSPFIPQALKDLLDFITYIGVGISIASLIICLVIEGIIWRSQTGNDISYMRHVSVVNVAVSLLIADIWFIIGAAVSGVEETSIGACRAATFFIHFFYLALFFWMLVSALLLFYHTVMVFSNLTRTVTMALAFIIGYGAPLLIAVVTIAATAGSGEYIRQNRICWLNWDQSMALLAFVIPALTIVAINFLIMLVVLYKILKRGVGNTRQDTDKHALVVIARCVAILTPLFGLTWGFGIGIMVAPDAVGLHIVFAALNSLQGLFILVFGTLLDSKTREALSRTLKLKPRSTQSGPTRSTSDGPSSGSSTVLDFFRGRRRRNVYNVSAGPISSRSGTSGTYSGVDT